MHRAPTLLFYLLFKCNYIIFYFLRLRKEVIIIKNKKLLLSLSVFLIAFLLTGCSLFNIPQTIDEVRLISIEVSPPSMTLEIGKSKAISSVTAHYDDGTEVNIALSACNYESSKPNVAKVLNGTITGLSSCTASTAAIITVTYTDIEDSITVTDRVSVVVTNPSPG